MKELSVTLALAVAMVAIAGWAPGQEAEQKGVPGSEKGAASAPVPAVKEMQGTTCPVLAGPIDKKYNYTYRGTIYYFCCPICVEKFKADPEKYTRKALPKK